MQKRHILTSFAAALLLCAACQPGSTPAAAPVTTTPVAAATTITTPLPDATINANDAQPHLSETGPAMVAFARMDGATGAARYELLSLACLTQPAGCLNAPRAVIDLPPTTMLAPVAWSPSAEQVAFLAGIDGNTDIYRANVDGSQLTNLTNDFVRRGNLSWSPDGQYLLFTQSGKSGDPDMIWVMRPDGSEARQVAEGNWPTWAPDSKFIFFTVQTGDVQDLATVRSDLYWLDFAKPLEPGEAARPVRITDLPGIKASPSVAPDGSHLAFTVLGDQEWAIFVANLNGLTAPIQTLDDPALTRLMPGHWNSAAVAWSPEGTWLAYAGNEGTMAAPEIYVVGVDGTGIINISNAPGWWDGALAWSSDGQQLAFASQSGGYSNIWLINRDGTGLTPLTQASPLIEYYEPSWAQ